MPGRFARTMLWIVSLLPDRLRVWIARSPAAPVMRSILTNKSETVGIAQIVAGPARGRQIITDLSVNRGYSVGTYEPDNVAIIRRVCRPGMTVMDVGAHEGYLTLVMAATVGDAGRVFAFEPMPQNFTRLSETVALNRLDYVFPYQKAVSDGHSSRASFEVSGYSSFTGKLIDGKKSSGESVIEVDVTSLDKVVESSGIDRVDFVKIDVEGHDLEVLEGMQHTILQFAPKILIEFHSPELLDAGCRFLSGHDYRWRMASPGTWTVFAETKIYGHTFL